jgi:T5SS/PEP-CTERM-associated repeat protein
LIIADGGVVVSAGGNVGNAASASSNMAVVSGVGSLWTNTSALYVGNLSAGNQLIITNGGRVFATSVTVGNAASANGNKVWIESGSLLNANALVMTNGVNNSIVFNGGTLNVKATAVSNGSVFTVGNGTDSAVFNLLGGTNSFANGLLINPNATLLISNINAASSLGTLTNQGLFNIASGNYRPGAGSVAAGSGVLRVGSGGVLDLTNGGFTMGNTLTNAGTVNVMNSHVTYAAPVVISGGYISDPSTNTFKDHVTVTPDGYLIGGLVVSNADQFVFEKDLFMLSTNRLFNVSKAGFLFTNSTSHLLSISNSGALNIGQGYASFSQVASNFAIGTLSIALGDKLTIAGNKDSKTNALYVGWLDIQGLGSPGMLTNTLGDVTNTLLLALSLPNVNLYYDVYDQRNNWLTAQLPSVAGAGYDLWNGGLLLPIPEPSALMLTLVAGALSAFILRRKDRK